MRPFGRRSKKRLTNRKTQYGVIPPDADDEDVACLENVLETDAQTDDPTFSVLCLDEPPAPLLKETRVSIPATQKYARRIDYEYERAGIASIFMFTEPLHGWRHVPVRE